MNRIAELRDERGVTQAQLAGNIGVSQSSLSRWEMGVNIVDTESAVKIADFFGVTLDYLLGRNDYPRSTSLTNREFEFMTLFRSLTQEKKDAVFQLVKTISR